MRVVLGEWYPEDEFSFMEKEGTKALGIAFLWDVAHARMQ
jgi:hypothetical protein